MAIYTGQPKKLMIINILDILRRYTDKEHRLSQKEIAEILKNEYQMNADRKAIRRNLMNLIHPHDAESQDRQAGGKLYPFRFLSEAGI